MGPLPSHSARSSGTEALHWPLLATTFLIGIGLVSLGDILSEDDLEVPVLALPANWEAQPLWLSAPGWEDVLATLPNPGRARVLAPWAPLPPLDEPVVLARPQGTPLPRMPESVVVDEEREAGAWLLTRLRSTDERPPPTGLDLLGELRRARVAFVHPDGSESRCAQWRFGRWACGLEEWLWVGPIELPFRDRLRSCLWAHPRAGDRLEIRFEDIPIGRRLTGRYGLSDLAVDAEDGAPVEWVVRVGERQRAFVAENRRGFFAWDLDTDPAERGEVVFSVTAERDGRRHFCFTANVQGLGGAPAGASAPDDGGDDEPERGVPPRSLEGRDRQHSRPRLTHIDASGEGTGSGAPHEREAADGEGSGTGVASGELP